MVEMNNPAGSETSPRTLYVGNLHQDVTEELIVALFNTMGSCHGCKIIREPGNDPYCFVEYTEHSEAAAALSAMNKRLCLGKEMKVNWASSPGNTPKVDTSKHYHIFVGDLSPDIETNQLRDAFLPFGSISDVKIIRDAQTLKSKGFGFVSFVKKEEAENAIAGMNGQWIGSRPIRTNWATRKPPAPVQRENYKQLDYDAVYRQSTETNSTVYVGGLILNDDDDSEQPYDDILRESFEEFGSIIEVRLFKDKGYAFVRYDKKESACNAIVQRNATILNGLTLKCSWGKEMGTSVNLNKSAPNPYPGSTAPPSYPPNYNSSGPYGSYNYGYWPGYNYQQGYQQGYTYPPYQYMQGYGYGTPAGQQDTPKETNSAPQLSAENVRYDYQNEKDSLSSERDSQRKREDSLPPPPPPLPYQDSRNGNSKDLGHSNSSQGASRYHPYERNNNDQNGQSNTSASSRDNGDYSYKSNISSNRYDEPSNGAQSSMDGNHYGSNSRYQDSSYNRGNEHNKDPYHQQYSSKEPSRNYERGKYDSYHDSSDNFNNPEDSIKKDGDKYFASNRPDRDSYSRNSRDSSNDYSQSSYSRYGDDTRY